MPEKPARATGDKSMRVYQYARELKMTPKQLLDICEKAGISGKTYVSGLKDQEIKKIKEQLKKRERSGKKIVITGAETVGELASKTALPAAEVISQFEAQGLKVSLNDRVSPDAMIQACEALGFACELHATRESYLLGTYSDKSAQLKKRAPVVTVMGHVDHGKTTILDRIRKTNVAAREFGQITQKIGASKVTLPEGSIVFIDTPGHEVFTAMRSRGAHLTDIVVLVVAADEGVKAQTIEAINHCKAANVPIIVAINKIDRPNANPEMVKKQLAEYGLIPEEWGGQTVFLGVSGLTGENIKELLEIILLMGEMLEVKANPNRPGEGVVLESYLHRQKGVVLHILVQNGTVQLGDYFVCGKAYGKVRAMFDEFGTKLKEAGPSTPVELLGASDLPDPGDTFTVTIDEADAKRQAEAKKETVKSQSAIPARKLTLEDLQRQIIEGAVHEMKIILKTDSIGAQEALCSSIEKLAAGAMSANPQRPKISLMHAGLGVVNESDVLLAGCSKSIILGYNVAIDPAAEKLAKQQGVEIKTYKLVYDLIDDVQNTLDGMVKPKEVEVLVGQALVKKVFKVGKNQAVAGCIVVEGKVIRDSVAKVVRDGKIIFDGAISSLKRFKNSVKEVTSNTECGIGITQFTDFKEGDIIQSFQKVAEGERV